jgi:lipopolysaccharide assembly outer membrane protein LptD (OstA)
MAARILRLLKTTVTKGCSRRLSTFDILAIASFALISCCAQLSSAQSITPPDRLFTFEEDSRSGRTQRKKDEAAIIKEEKAPADDVHLSAPRVEVLQGTHEIKGTGGALLSGNGIRVQSDTAVFNTETKDAALDGGILFSVGGGEISADTAAVNMEREAGVFKKAELDLDEGDYKIQTSELNKLTEFDYQLEDSSFSTCRCDDGSMPWSITCARANLRDEGYAHTYNTRFNLFDTPILYSPYFLFPVKRERATGLLAPSFGTSNRDGLQFSIPLFVVIDDSTDLTVTPFIHTNSREGSQFQFRKSFSMQNEMETYLGYSDESKRGDSLRGTIYLDPSNPTVPVTSLSQLSSRKFSEDRFGIYHNHVWSSEKDAVVPASFIADIHYVSDDLYLREMPSEQIGDFQSPFLVSTVAARVSPLDFVTAQVSGEYKQFLDATDDDIIFRRGPEFVVRELKSFRPFGFNPYGVKLVTSSGISHTSFTRTNGYEGTRTDYNPGISVPFRLSSYLSNVSAISLNHTKYSLGDSLVDPRNLTTPLTEDSQTRTVFRFSDTLSTALERVYPVEEEGVLQTLAGLGISNKDQKLARVKHVLSPRVNYLYVPKEDQSENPFFDPLDRINQRSLVTFSLDNSILGRFLPRNEVQESIPEIAPEVEDLPLIAMDQFPGQLGAFDGINTLGSGSAMRTGTVREVMNFGIVQSYDLNAARVEETTNISPWSNIGAYYSIYPSDSLGFRIETDYNRETHDVARWAITTILRDDRGDSLRLRYKYLDNSFNQIEGNAEVRILDRLKLGYYARYNDTFTIQTGTDAVSGFLENRAVLRFYGGCNCWSVDLGYSERINPDREDFILNFSFAGLGDVTQNVLYRRNKQTPTNAATP